MATNIDAERAVIICTTEDVRRFVDLVLNSRSLNIRAARAKVVVVTEKRLEEHLRNALEVKSS